MVPSAYYNENDRYPAQWLRNLMDADLIMKGIVDERSIADVQPADVAGYDRCHFFAGIAGWELALRLAGWPNDLPIWTGSCPCQPFSNAGKRLGAADERHLWPVWCQLIKQCKPAIVVGEQVASKAGREWLAGVRTDLEALGYAVGAADLCAASVQAHHIRQRLWWVAVANNRQMRGTRYISKAIPQLPRLSWCEDGRRIKAQGYGSSILEPVVRLYSDGFPGGVANVGAYGNAIVPQLAATFLQAVMEVIS